METNKNDMRDRLLSRLPQPGNLADYRSEVAALLEKNDKGLRREKRGVAVIWFSVVGVAVALLVGAGRFAGPAKASQEAYLGTIACFLLIYGAVEVMKHFINRTRVEMLREIKQLQLQVLELQESVSHK